MTDHTHVLLLTFYMAVHSVLVTGVAESVPESDLPNILIVYADDQGYGDFSLQNPESKIPTPNLDQLAREGVRFTDAHSASGICSPSRYSLLTGRYFWRDNISGTTGNFGGSWLDENRLTLPEMLQEKGYRTAAIGKWHLGWQRPKDLTEPLSDGPLAHGFDYYFGPGVPIRTPMTWIENNSILYPPTEPYRPVPPPQSYHFDAGGSLGGGHDTVPDGKMAENWRLDEMMPRITREAVEWIGKQSSARPFFLHWSWASPHTPVVPIEAYQHSSGAGAYGDYVHQSDAHLGRVLRALEKNGFADNTIVIFTSDNGPEKYTFDNGTDILAYGRIKKYGHDSRGPLRGVKRDVWEGGHRVPFVIRWPGVVEPGTVSSQLISQLDLLATFAALVDYKLPDDAAEDSYNLLPLIKGKTDRSPRDTLVYHTGFSDGQWGLRHEEWVWINSTTGSRRKKEPDWLGYPSNPHDMVLNNLEQDLEQTENLVDQYPEKAKSMKKRLQTVRKRGYSSPRLTSEEEEQ